MTLLAQVGSQLPQRYYLGVDVGYREHVASVIGLQVFLRGDERWKRARCLHFPSTQVGLAKLQQYLDGYSADHQAFLGLCEPTGGFYGATVMQYLLDQGYDIKLIANATTRHMREKIFGGVPKTDELDARVMARIGYLHEAVGEEFTLQPLVLPKADDSDLLALCRENWQLGVMITRVRNQFTQLLAVIFPELKAFFTWSVSTVVPVSLMAAFPTPADLAAASPEEVAQVLAKAQGQRHLGRIAELQALALDSSGILPDPGRAWRLAWMANFLLDSFKAQSALEKRMRELLVQRDDYPLLASLPYAGPATLGIILAVTRDARRFSNYRQYVAYSGYYAGLEQSQTIDHTRMSKRGNRDLKRALFLVAAPLVWFDKGDNPYKALYQRKKAEGRAWYETMPFVCAALARHIHHCLKSREPYDVAKAFKGAVPTPASEQALVDLLADLDAKFEVLDAHLCQIEA